MRLFRDGRGFTLVEILTVLAVLGVLSTIGVVMFGKIMDYQKNKDVFQSLNIRFLDIAVRIGEDFDQLASFSISGGRIIGERRVEVNKRYRSVPLDDDRITLPVVATNADGKAKLVYVKYYIDRELGGAPKLVRVVSNLDIDDVDNIQGAKEILFSGVFAMRIFYFDGKSWVDSWNKDYYPEGVKISFVLADEDRPWDQIVREKVFWIGNML